MRRGASARLGRAEPTCGTVWVMRRTKKVYSFQINLVPDEDGGYTVLVPLLPGCVSYGRTIEQATSHAREAIELHLENLAAHGQPFPAGGQAAPVFTTVVHVSPAHV